MEVNWEVCAKYTNNINLTCQTKPLIKSIHFYKTSKCSPVTILMLRPVQRLSCNHEYNSDNKGLVNIQSWLTFNAHPILILADSHTFTLYARGDYQILLNVYIGTMRTCTHVLPMLWFVYTLLCDLKLPTYHGHRF